MKLTGALVTTAAMLMLGSMPRLAEAQCAVLYTDSYVNETQGTLDAWAGLEDYFTSGACGFEGGWGYFEHYYVATAKITNPAQTEAYAEDFQVMPYGGGSAWAWTSISYIGVPGDYIVELLLEIYCSLGGFLGGDDDLDTIEIAPVPCTIQFTLESPDDFLISATPTMPAIEAEVSLLLPPWAAVDWAAKVTHTAPSTKCSGGPTFESSWIIGTGSSFSPTFGGFYGDNLTVIAACYAPGYAASGALRTDEIQGTQPSDTEIVSKIGTVASPFDPADLRRIACHESGLTQFASTGMPYYGGGGDTGIMQMCHQRTNEHLWNWHDNIDSGRSTLTTSKNSAKNHLDHAVNVEGATPYSTEMWRQEGIHRYNAGTGSGNEYLEWNPEPLAWEIVDRGGVGGYTPSVLALDATCTDPL